MACMVKEVFSNLNSTKILIINGYLAIASVAVLAL